MEENPLISNQQTIRSKKPYIQWHSSLFLKHKKSVEELNLRFKIIGIKAVTEHVEHMSE